VEEIDVAEIVQDDIVMLNPGDKIPADGKIIEAISLSANEAILTGESEPIIKQIDDIAFMGTNVLSGRGIMKVTSTGLSTELGKIAESLREIKAEATPLQVRLEKFGKTLTYIVIGICLIIFITGLILRFAILDSVRLSVVLAIAAIPEGLPIAVTMILVIGMRAIFRRKGLVRKLLAVEILGTVTTICTDKTGTLTQGIMQVVKTDFRSDQKAAYIMTLCNDLADSLEVSLWNHVKTMDLDPQEIYNKFPRTDEIPFSSENKYMLTTNMFDGEEVGLLKGAPDIIMEYCDLSSNEREALLEELEEWAGLGFKVLALAIKEKGNPREVKDFTWMGIIGIEDPIRPTVKDAIALCRRAGIRVKMITGDYRKTAEKVAQNLGLMVGSNQIIEGKDLENITEEDLTNIVKNIVIFCRVTPQHKLKIINALQMNQEITAMIGDGVNDAPALKKSNIGVSVGNATEVAKETASLFSWIIISALLLIPWKRAVSFLIILKKLSPMYFPIPLQKFSYCFLPLS
jgi:Ca2+-transporting ATPase